MVTAELQITQEDIGATQLDGVTADAMISNHLLDIPTTLGPTMLATYKDNATQM